MTEKYKRQCGTCTLCCKVMRIEELDKPVGQWCPNCAVGKGCNIYAERPQSCRDFHCGYMFWEDNIGEHWYPAKSRMVIVSELNGKRIGIRVDPSRPDAWRQAPYYNEIKAWAQHTRVPEGRDDAFAVTVHIGERWIWILPDREVDVGTVADDEIVATAEMMTPSGPRIDVIKVRKDDPRLAANK
jgi:hypothetical protein